MTQLDAPRRASTALFLVAIVAAFLAGRATLRVADGRTTPQPSLAAMVPATVMDDDDDDEQLSVDRIPAEARQTLLRAANGHEITGAERDTEHGVELYEATWNVDGTEHEAAATVDGWLVLHEQVVTADDVPPSVVHQANRLLPEGDREYERVALILYEVEVEADGAEHEILVTATGHVLDDDDDDDDDDD